MRVNRKILLMVTLFLLLLQYSAVCADDPPKPSSSDSICRLIAQSDIILTGILLPPMEKFQKMAADGDSGYVDIVVDIQTTHKGAPEQTPFSFSAYFDSEETQNILKLFSRHEEQESILFLVKVDDPYVEGIYLIGGLGGKSIKPAEPSLVKKVNIEILHQEEFLAKFEKAMNEKSLPHFQSVKT